MGTRRRHARQATMWVATADLPMGAGHPFFARLNRVLDAHLVQGHTVGIDATTLEANAAMRSIVRRETGESYDAFLTRLAEASGLATPTRAELARLDRRRHEERPGCRGPRLVRGAEGPRPDQLIGGPSHTCSAWPS